MGFKHSENRFRWKGLLITVFVFLAVIALFAFLLGRTGQTADREQATLLRNSLASAAVSAYATEGAYPATLADIQRNYGIVIDPDRFFVDYDIFATNVMPSITVTMREK